MKIKYIALCLLLVLVSCQRDEEMEIGQVSVSNERLEESYSSVEISCTFQTNVTIKNVKAYLSTTEDFSSATSYSLTEKAKNTFGATIEGLKDASTYYVRYKISNRWSSKMIDKVSEFKTIPYTIPTVQTSEVSDVTHNTAIVGGVIIEHGGQEIIERGVVYSTNQSPTTEDSKVVIGSGLGEFTCSLSDLQDGVTYYVRAYAINAKGIAYGEEVSFTTNTKTIPTITTAQATNISYTSATVGGKVTEDGGASVTERGVVYSTNQNPTTENSKVTSGSGLGEFACSLTDLQDGVTYYARAYAINAKGIAYGEEVSFTTNTKTIPTITTAQATNISYTSATVGGNVTDDGGASVTERGVVYSTNQNPTTENSKVTSGSGLGEFACSLTNLQDGVTYYVRAYAINVKGTAYGEEVSFVIPTRTEHNGYEYVDLGLPSGLKWATMNVGASKAEDYGGYYAWGETTTKSTYDWNTYKYCNGSNNTLTKYNTNSEYGTIDNKTQLELSDDAAHVNWGGDWRMPTDAEWTELREQCTWTWTTQNGVNGYKVTSKSNANSIFLPAAGHLYESSLSFADWGDYWSSSLNTNIYACVVDFNSDFVRKSRNGRQYGLSVRPVLGENEVEATTPTLITSAVTQITATTAVTGGNVISDGTMYVTERGVCVATGTNPTTSNTKVKGGSGIGAFICTLSGLQPNTTYYVRAYAINSKGTAYGDEVCFTTKGESSLPNNGTENGHAYVDLGLSVKWATMNVGASKVEDYGGYYAWGETTTKSTYDWSTYKWCNGSSSTLTKYNTSSSYGTVDNKTTLELSDDVAHVNWGGAWRMPTDAELTELHEQCTWTWTNLNGVDGYMVTSKKSGYTNNFIFLPPAGCRVDSRLGDVGAAGIYWSSSLYTSSYHAFTLNCFSSHQLRTSQYRYYGYSVRPVCP